MKYQKLITKYFFSVYLIVFQIAFIILFGIFGDYEYSEDGTEKIKKLYPMYQDVHTMMFIGFGFLMTFLKRYGYSSVGFNMLIAAYVTEWALIIRGFIEQGLEHGNASFTISVSNLLVADFCSAAVLISFGAVLGKASATQLLVMATIEVVIQGFNEHIGVHYLKAYDVGESMYVHVFGAYFGLAVAKVLNHNKVESEKESAYYHSDIFAMIGTVFLWLFWPSFNGATAVDEGQNRAIVNTVLSIASSCVVTFLVSNIVGKGKLNMVHIQNATLAGGVAVGTVADMVIKPFGAMIIGSFAGLVSTLGYVYITPLLKRIRLHDTCGVNNLHGMPGLISGVCGAIVAVTATRDNYLGNNLYKFYPSRIPSFNSTDYFQYGLNTTGNDYIDGGLGRTASVQAGYQAAGLALSLGMSIVGGILTGFILKIPIFEQIKEEGDFFDDETSWETPDDFNSVYDEINRRKLVKSETSKL